jgi:hypothetical protein
MAGIDIGFGINSNAADTQAVGGFDHPAGNLAPIRYQNLVKHEQSPCRVRLQPLNSEGRGHYGWQ